MRWNVEMIEAVVEAIVQRTVFSRMVIGCMPQTRRRRRESNLEMTVFGSHARGECCRKKGRFFGVDCEENNYVR